MKPHFNRCFTAISKLQMQFHSFLSFQKSLKIWKSEFDLTNFTGTFYHWCHLIINVNDAIMQQLQNESTRLLNILLKNLWLVSMLKYKRKIETFWNPLFDDKSAWYRCIQNVVIRFAGAINKKQTYLTIQLPVWMPQVIWSRTFQDIFTDDDKSVFVTSTS